METQNKMTTEQRSELAELRRQHGGRLPSFGDDWTERFDALEDLEAMSEEETQTTSTTTTETTTMTIDSDADTRASLQALNSSDDPEPRGGKRYSTDGQGNELWVFGKLVANRHEDDDGEVEWSGNVEGWGYTQRQVISNC